MTPTRRFLLSAAAALLLAGSLATPHTPMAR